MPLDYDKPTGATLLLDLVKVPATRPAAKLGSLFVNPGGPGGSSTDFAPSAAQELGALVRQRYDVIGIDPRGVGAHSQISCSTSMPAPPEAPPFPITLTQATSVWRVAQWIRRGCQDDPNHVIDHMSTADTARDMDLIRQAVGDERLNYFGFSYGTYLGTVYASMFPGRVGRFAIDGVLDPIAWVGTDPDTTPFTTRLRSAKGAYEALTTGLRVCDQVGKPECVFAGNAAGKWRTLVAEARAGTLSYAGQPISYQELVGGVLGYLYMENYSTMAATMQEVWANRDRRGAADRGAASALSAQAERVARAPFLSPLARAEVPVSAFNGVGCADTHNPTERSDWWRAGKGQDASFPWFGSMWTWMSAACANWRPSAQADAWFGPMGGRTANPILVVTSTYDPATPIHGARKVASLFPSSRLLRYNGWGHGALGASNCAGAIYNRFYGTGTLPSAGTVCQPDQGLFEH